MSGFSVRKPYTVLVGVILAIVLGVVSFTKTTTDLLPNISLPYVIVVTTYPGASPETVESVITQPVEASMATVSNIETIQSVSSESYSMVILEFSQSTNMDSISLEIREKLDQVKAYWSDSVGNPMIMKLNPNMLPVMIAAVGVDGMDNEQISSFVKDQLMPELESIEGVASASSTGLLEKSVHVVIRKEKVDQINEKVREAIDRKMADAAKEIEEGRQKLDDGQKELLDGQQGILDGQKGLLDGQKQLEDGKKELANKQEETLSQLAATKSTLNTAKAQLEATKVTMTLAKGVVDPMMTRLNDLEKRYEELEKLVNDRTSRNDNGSGSGSSGDNAGGESTGNTGNGTGSEGSTGNTGSGTGSEGSTGSTGSSEGSEGSTGSTGSGTGSEGSTGNTGSGTGTDGNAANGEGGNSAAGDSDAQEDDDWREEFRNALKTFREQILQSQFIKDAAEENPALKAALERLEKMDLDSDPKSLMEVLKDTLKNLQDTINSTLSTLDSTLATINQGLEAVEKGELTAAIEFANASAGIALGEYQMELSKSQLDAAQEQIKSGQEQLDEARRQLEEGEKQLDEARESAYEQADMQNVLTVQTIEGLLTAQNFSMPAGYVMEEGISYLIRVGDKPTSVEELQDMPLIDMHMDGVEAVRLGDVADVFYADNSDSIYTNVNGSAGVILSLQKQTGYSTGDVSDKLKSKFKKMMKEDSSLHIITLMDQGIYIDMVMDSIVKNILFGGGLAIFILLLFLRDLRPTMVVAFSIPISLVTAIVCMYFSGVTLNVISLSGLALGIGMLVDNSIVVIIQL